MKALVAMETSGEIREALIAQGVRAFSVDLLPAIDNSPHHYQGDVFDMLFDRHWDLIVAHPDCTKLCVSGNHVYAEGKPRFVERRAAVQWTENLWNICCELCNHVVFENPVGVLSTMSNLPKPKYIQPYEFGDDASKKTALYLYGLQPLVKNPEDRVPGRMVDGKERWDNQTDSGQNRLGPSPNRWSKRSKTYPGIAHAIAEQFIDQIKQRRQL